jgi:N-acetylneuraminate synthase
MIYESLGNFKRTVSKAEEEKKKTFRRSIVLNKNLKSGDTIREEDISLKRPGTGFSPKEIKFVVGKKLKKDFESDFILTKNDII